MTVTERTMSFPVPKNGPHPSWPTTRARVPTRKTNARKIALAMIVAIAFSNCLFPFDYFRLAELAPLLVEEAIGL